MRIGVFRHERGATINGGREPLPGPTADGFHFHGKDHALIAGALEGVLRGRAWTGTSSVEVPTKRVTFSFAMPFVW
ncbi:hypothetical protein [Candidatus Amarobacter glycogenicus]|uniref:hypothetical protein n=1 Tax=Candidatus Amarobacter glycogenicus TaxID=3140699 RepID=UPI002A0D1959|nr:hypothetical protein [Dehalococcoidia bacterium]